MLRDGDRARGPAAALYTASVGTPNLKPIGRSIGRGSSRVVAVEDGPMPRQDIAPQHDITLCGRVGSIINERTWDPQTNWRPGTQKVPTACQFGLGLSS